MSRVAKSPVAIPAGVDVSVNDGQVVAKGPKGELKLSVHPSVEVSHDGDELKVQSLAEGSTALAGTTRALVNNLVAGVTTGFEQRLTVVGVGYRAQSQGRTLNLTLGFSHPVACPVPQDVEVETPSQTEIVVRGADKQRVGQVAAEIRQYRPPEPYKGKGVRYSDEHVVRKQAKKK